MAIYSTLNTSISGYSALDKNAFLWSTWDGELNDDTCATSSYASISMADVINGEFSPSESSKSQSVCENKRLFEILEEVQGGSVGPERKHDSGTINTANRRKLVYIVVGIVLMLLIYFFLGFNNFSK
jgi:hypothetical protein